MRRVADVEAARERLAGIARETAVYPDGDLLPADGVGPFSLKAENLQRTGSFKDPLFPNNTIAHARGGGARGGRRRGERRQPRSGGGVGRARGGDLGDDLHAAGRADGEGRGHALVRRGNGAGSVRRSRTLVAAAQAHVERNRRDPRPRVRGRAVVAGQGTIGLELAEQAPACGDGRHPRRRRRARRLDPLALKSDGRTCAPSASSPGRATPSRTGSR